MNLTKDCSSTGEEQLRQKLKMRKPNVAKSALWNLVVICGGLL